MRTTILSSQVTRSRYVCAGHGRAANQRQPPPARCQSLARCGLAGAEGRSWIRVHTATGSGLLPGGENHTSRPLELEARRGHCNPAAADICPWQGQVRRRLAVVRGTDRRPDHFWPRSTFLSKLTESARRRLIGLGVIGALPANHILIRQGDPGGSVWLLLDAMVKVSASVENGNQALLAIRVSGDVVGEMAVIDGSMRSADVTTCGRAVVCQIKGAQFVDYLRRDSDVSLALSQSMIQRLRWSDQRRLDLAGYDTPVCLARILLTLAARHGRSSALGTEIGVPLTQAELGGLVGAKEGTVQKALRELATRDLARPGHRSVTITDLAGLAAFADLPNEYSSRRHGTGG